MTPAYNPWFEAVGMIAAVLTTSSFLPQAFRIWRTRSARDISLVMYVMMTTGTALWLGYGALIGSPSLVVANFTCLIMVASVLALKIRDMLRKRPVPIAELSPQAMPEPVNSNLPESHAAVPPAA